jgi:transketolase
VAKGAYILVDSDNPELILIATGSEVSATLEAGKALQGKGRRVRVVSMPCWELFDEQPQEYRDSVLPPAVRKRLAVEAGVSHGWHKYVGLEGEIHGIERFGASAPAKDLAREFGFTPEKIVEHAEGMLKG